MDLSPSLLWKGSSLENKNSFEKWGIKFLKLKKIEGDEWTILKNKVKAMEKNRLTNKKPTLDTMSKCRIPIL